MSYTVNTTEQFENDLEKYVVKRKCFDLIEDIEKLKEDLENGNFTGDVIQGLHLPENEASYKVRQADTSHNIGKRGGFRIIYYVIKNDAEVYLLTIYHKRDMTDIDKKKLSQLINEYCG